MHLEIANAGDVSESKCKCRGDESAQIGNRNECRGDESARIGSKGKCRGDKDTSNGSETAHRGKAVGGVKSWGKGF